MCIVISIYTNKTRVSVEIFANNNTRYKIVKVDYTFNYIFFFITKVVLDVPVFHNRRHYKKRRVYSLSGCSAKFCIVCMCVCMCVGWVLVLVSGLQQ